MRKFINVVGVGLRKTGTAKNGRNYDFVPVSFTHEDDYKQTDGLLAETVNIPGPMFESAGPIKPGDVLDVALHTANYRICIDAIL